MVFVLAMLTLYKTCYNWLLSALMLTLGVTLTFLAHYGAISGQTSPLKLTPLPEQIITQILASLLAVIVISLLVRS